MRICSSVIIATVFWLAPAAAGAAAPSQAQLPPPPPLVPERSRPVPPLFPAPQLPQPRVQPVPPPEASLAPRIVCGMRVMLVDPAIDPQFVIPVPEAGAQSAIPAPEGTTRYPIREVVPPAPCR